AATGDSRAIEAGLKFGSPGNPTSVRSAAFQVLAQVGKGNDRALEALLSALKEKSTQIKFSALQALGKLGDPRAIPALEELRNSPEVPPFAKQFITNTINQLKSAKVPEEKKE